MKMAIKIKKLPKNSQSVISVFSNLMRKSPEVFDLDLKIKNIVIARYIILILIFSVFSLFAMSLRVDAAPSGATNITPINSSTANSPSPQFVNAYAGNVSEMNIFGYSTTQSWQGFYGNVTGVVQLANSANHVMYNWSNLNPKGEIYASANNSINWANVQCFNYTANGTYCSADNSRGGYTSLCGMNLSQLQTNYNISSDDIDAVNNTFTLNNHELFYTGNLQFDSGECKNMKVYNSTGAGTYDEVLLYEPTGKSVIFSSILQKNADGFDSKTHDFEMLVLENGHNGDVSSTPYYFYLELQ